MEAAGKTEEAVRQYLAAARELGSRGEVKRALMLTRQALTALEGVPDSEGRSLLRSEAMLVRARLQWQGSGLGPPYLLRDAFTDHLREIKFIEDRTDGLIRRAQ